MITIEQLREICPGAPKNADVFIPYLNKYMPVYGITTAAQVAMFLAQVAHESGQFRYTQEIASGKAYEGRKDLGNIYPGDGVKFKGHGLIQITGRDNHKRCGQALGLDLVNHPDLLTSPQYAVQSACWFWQANNLGVIADNPEKKYTVIKNKKKYTLSAFEYLTTRINGWLNGLEDRVKYWERVKAVLNSTTSLLGRLDINV